MKRCLLALAVPLAWSGGAGCSCDPGPHDDPCETGEVSCVDASPPMDAGPDGGPGDASTPDDTDTGAIPLECDTVAPTECNDPGISYADDIAPILAARCIPCHDGSAEQWPLTSYTHVVDWRPDIRTRMLDCSMPPPDAGIPITLAERQRILDWIRCDAPP